MSKRKSAPVSAGSVHNPVFRYTSTCCSAPAEKPPLLMPKGRRIGIFVGARPEAEGTLGSWRCTNCRKPCAVTRSKNKQEVTA